MGSLLESILESEIVGAGLPQPEREFRFHPVRRWRFDFAWPALRLAVEIEGGAWVRGRHTRGPGFSGDCEKYNAATLGGWKILRFTPDAIRDGRALGVIREALGVSPA